jgi:hypothetical protein
VSVFTSLTTTWANRVHPALTDTDFDAAPEVAVLQRLAQLPIALVLGVSGLTILAVVFLASGVSR